MRMLHLNGLAQERIGGAQVILTRRTNWSVVGSTIFSGR
jgi:hypothetical protein